MEKSIKPSIGYFEPSVVFCRITGEKGGHLLHGQLSNHINGLKPGEGNYNLLLTQKGKVAADLYVYRRDADYLLIIDKPGEQKVIDHLRKFAPLSRVEIGDETSKYFLVHAFGTTPVHFSFFRSDRLGLPGHDLFVPAGEKNKLLAWLKQANLPAITPETQEIIRVEQGVCKVGIDATEENLPQECRLDRALPGASFRQGMLPGAGDNRPASLSRTCEQNSFGTQARCGPAGEIGHPCF
ncbi:MAG: hypothetical protein HYU99_04780 [Deltaproteobacteria bacterium]|nr:hypothetical protein [Deltaproteobacteria bacterium]